MYHSHLIILVWKTSWNWNVNQIKLKCSCWII